MPSPCLFTLNPTPPRTTLIQLESSQGNSVYCQCIACDLARVNFKGLA